MRLFVEPGRVDFGAVRKGELPSVKITARVTGADGDVEGRVVLFRGLADRASARL